MTLKSTWKKFDEINKAISSLEKEKKSLKKDLEEEMGKKTSYPLRKGWVLKRIVIEVAAQVIERGAYSFNKFKEVEA